MTYLTIGIIFIGLTVALVGSKLSVDKISGNSVHNFVTKIKNIDAKINKIYLIVPDTITLDGNSVSHETAMEIIVEALQMKGFAYDGDDQSRNAMKYKYKRLLK